MRKSWNCKFFFFDFFLKIDNLFFIHVFVISLYYVAYSWKSYYLVRNSFLSRYIYPYDDGIIDYSSSFGICNDTSRLDSWNGMTQSISRYFCWRYRISCLSYSKLFYSWSFYWEAISWKIWKIYPYHERKIPKIWRFISQKSKSLHLSRSSYPGCSTPYFNTCWDFPYAVNSILDYYLSWSDTLVWYTGCTWVVFLRICGYFGETLYSWSSARFNPTYCILPLVENLEEEQVIIVQFKNYSIRFTWKKYENLHL